MFAGDLEVTLTSEHELSLNTNGKLTLQNFDTRQYEDDFFRWSALRSGYLSEASVDEARLYVGVGPGWYGPGWYGSGWYWNPNFFVLRSFTLTESFIVRLALYAQTLPCEVKTSPSYRSVGHNSGEAALR